MELDVIVEPDGSRFPLHRRTGHGVNAVAFVAVGLTPLRQGEADALFRSGPRLRSGVHVGRRTFCRPPNDTAFTELRALRRCGRTLLRSSTATGSPSYEGLAGRSGRDGES